MPSPLRVARFTPVGLAALMLMGCAGAATMSTSTTTATAVPEAEYVQISGWPAAVPTVALNAGGGIAPESVAAAEAAEPGWKKKYFKIGARLYPRCMPAQLTGTNIHDTGVICLTDYEIAQIEDGKQDFAARFGQNIRMCGSDACAGGAN